MGHHVKYHKEIDQATLHLKGTNKTITNADIIDLTKNMFNYVDKRYIQGTDHSVNHHNEGACECQGSDKALFHYNGWNSYKRI